MGLDNFESSPLVQILRYEYNLYPAMVGLGIPQRTASYILGRQA